MHTIKPVTFFGMTDLVVVGQNSEMADFDNPRGDIIRSAAYVVAEDEKGYRVRMYIRTGHDAEVLAAAQALAERLKARLATGKLPVGFSAWQETYPSYGSEAFVESGQGEMDAWMDRMEEEFYA